ncbi:Hypothetical predicted protein [Mytilus galloprovincialis]|uniref:Uncharacterized protein n=1 Tax=Mytilus galloprovincialis TaxID=29158 RepID=A0A8B6GAH8_MYTGA|nr:Hypothetical predicted protein [Mytilus galloprovincialis]
MHCGIVLVHYIGNPTESPNGDEWLCSLGRKDNRDPQQQPKEQMFTPPKPPPPYIATPIVTPGGKRQHDPVGDEPQPKRQIVSTEGNFNPLEFFQHLQQFEGK